MFSAIANPKRTSPNRWATASVALHLGLLAALLLTRAPQLAAVDRAGGRNGHSLLLTYAPGSSAPVATLQAQRQPPAQPTPLPTLTAPAPATPASPSTVAGTGSGSGNDALGDGDIKIAMQLQHPYPKPDLSKLPSGTRGDVIVDVVIDAQGHIAKSTMEHGLGYGVDEAVLATVQQWTFQPATRNGVPVASEQELLFHYERG